MKRPLVKFYISVLLLTCMVGPVAWAEDDSNCELALAPGSILSTDEFKGYLHLPTGAEIFARVQRPRIGLVRRWYFLIHGLMDSHRAYDTIADRLLRRGYGVVRMDLRGFARSLHREYERTESRGENYLPPQFISYHDQVADLKALLKLTQERFGVERPYIVGHSMGGGLAMALLADPEASQLVGPRAVVIAPYVYRLEYFLAEKFALPGFAAMNPIQDWDSWVPGIMKMSREFVMDVMVSNTQMRMQFGEYFDQLAERRLPPIPEADWNKIKNRHVETAIAVVKGLRDLNSINMAAQIPNHIQVDLIYGEDDQLIEASLARKMARALARRGGAAFPIKAGHFVLDTAPGEVLRILTR